MYELTAPINLEQYPWEGPAATNPCQVRVKRLTNLDLKLPEPLPGRSFHHLVNHTELEWAGKKFHGVLNKERVEKMLGMFDELKAAAVARFSRSAPEMNPRPVATR